MITTDPHTGKVTLINVIEITPEHVERFINAWRERVQIMHNQPGFGSATLYRATSAEDRFQLINVAHWRDADAFHRAFANPEFQQHIDDANAALGLEFDVNYSLYTAAVDVRA